MSKQRMPTWASVTWLIVVLGAFAFYAVGAVRISDTTEEFLGGLWFAGFAAAIVAVMSGVILFALVWLIAFLRARAKVPSSEADNSDVANLVP